MAPKKKGGKKVQDDWEADLGESVAPQDGAAAPAEPAAKEPAAADEGMGGGLMAAIQRRGKKKGKKGADQDFVEGEDPTANGTGAGADTGADLESKAPEEGNLDDDDVFAGNYKAKKEKPAEENPKPKAEEPSEDSGRVKTKAEKEKEKKEKEKQRKKELVCSHKSTLDVTWLTNPPGCEEEGQWPYKNPRPQTRRSNSLALRTHARCHPCCRRRKEEEAQSCARCTPEAARGEEAARGGASSGRC
jgi:hypothetical protein